MSYVTIIIFALYLLFVLYLRNRGKKRQKWNPFEQTKMTTTIKRKDGSMFERPFKRFEYIGQEVDSGTIIGIYFVRTKPKTKKQLKYEKLCEKWR